MTQAYSTMRSSSRLDGSSFRRRGALPFLLGIVLFSSPLCSVVASTLVSQDISGSVAWSKERGPYLIGQNIVVDEGSSLAIGPGSVIVFGGAGSLAVKGSLSLSGNGDETVSIAPVSDGSFVPSNAAVISIDGGSARMEGIQSAVQLIFSLESGSLSIASSTLSGISLAASSSSVRIEDTSLHQISSITATQGSALSLNGSSIGAATDPFAAFSISGSSSLSVSDGSISHIASSFARIVGGSSLSLSSTSVSEIGLDGVALEEGSHTTILESEISDYGGTGIFASSSDVSILDSRIVGGEVGIENLGSHISVERSSIVGARSYAALSCRADFHTFAVNDFWGVSSGPRHAISNPSGAGGEVSDSVDFSPWLSHDPGLCCSSVLFLPGFEGSRLYKMEEGKERRIWEPTSDKDIKLLELNEGKGKDGGVYAKEGDVIGDAYAPLGGFTSIYKSFLGDLERIKSTGVIADWRTASYDWRFAADDASSTERIVGQLDELATSSKTGRVTIIAHSNGGLVAKSVVDALTSVDRGSVIDKIVFISVPQTGAPEAVGALLHGFGQGIPLLASPQAMRKLGLDMPSAYGLLPSDAYFARDNRPIVSFDVKASPLLDAFRNAYGSQISSSDPLRRFLKGSEGRSMPKYDDLASPNVLKSSLIHDANESHATLDRWMPPEQSALVEIAGRGIDTLTGISYYQGRRGGKDVVQYKPVLSADGDGTVPLNSAWALSAKDNIRKFSVDLRAANAGSLIHRYHADILEVPQLRSFVESLIREKPARFPKHAILSEGGEEPQPTRQKLRIFLHSGSASLGAISSSGAFAGVASSTGLVENGVVGVDYRMFGDVKYIGIDMSEASSSIAVSIGDTTASSSSVSVDIDLSDGETASSSVSYTDISLSASSTILIDIPSGTATSSSPILPPLRIDRDGDGRADETVIPDQGQDLQVPPIEASSSVASIASNSTSRHRSKGYSGGLTPTATLVPEPAVRAQPSIRGSSTALVAPPSLPIAVRTNQVVASSPKPRELDLSFESLAIAPVARPSAGPFFASVALLFAAALISVAL